MSYLTRPLHVDGNKIRDDLGTQMFLRGVNKGACWVDRPGGTWLGQEGWNATRASQELDMIKSWTNCNVVRMHEAFRYWKDNVVDPVSGLSHRQIVRAVAELCAQKGLYFFFDGYQTAPRGEPGHIGINYQNQIWWDGQPPSLPWAPYNDYMSGTQRLHSPVIETVAQWISIWQSIADELKDLPNVTLEPYNEPNGMHGPSVGPIRDEYFAALQQCMNAIRNRGFQGLLIYQWDYGTYVNMAYMNGETIGWVNQYNLTGSNLVPSTHQYYGYGVWQWNKDGVLTYLTSLEDITLGLEYMLAGVHLTHPVFIGEFGGDFGPRPGITQAMEQEGYRNQLQAYRNLGIHYAGFWWRSDGIHRMYDSNSNPLGTLNIYGTILRDAIAGGGGGITVPLTVNSNVKVEVTVDSVPRGQTPVTVDITPGVQHTVSVPPEVDV